MYRIDGPGSVAEKPARTPLSPSGHGWFAQLGPGNTVATRITAEWLNMLQAELSGVVTASGLALNKANDGQLAAAIQALITASIPAAEATKFPVEEKTSNFNVVAGDLRKMFVVDAPAGGVAVTPAAVATLGDGFLFGVVNRGTGTVTIDPNGTEKIGGRPGAALNTFQLLPGESAMFAADLETSQLDVVAYTPLPPVPPAPQPTRFPAVEVNGNFNITVADLRTAYFVNAPGGGCNALPAPCASLGDGFYFSITNRGPGIVTLDPSGGEQVGGRPGAPTNTFNLLAGESALFVVDLDTNRINVVSYVSLPPVTSFNGRTGAIGLGSGDVTGALGYTPAHGVGPGDLRAWNAINAENANNANALGGQGPGFYQDIPARLGYRPPFPPDFGLHTIVVNGAGFNAPGDGGMTWMWLYTCTNNRGLSGSGISPGGTYLGVGGEGVAHCWRIR